MGDNKKDNKNNIYYTIFDFYLGLIVLVVLALSIGTLNSRVEEEEPVYKVDKISATIKDTEAVGGDTVHYNTYFELKDGSIMRLEDDKVYTYARFNKGGKVNLEVTSGELKTEAKDEYGNVIYVEDNSKDKEKGKKPNDLIPKVYVDKYKYISDVFVDGKSVKYVE